MLDNFEVLKFTGNRLEILILWLQYYSDTFIWISWKEYSWTIESWEQTQVLSYLGKQITNFEHFSLPIDFVQV